MYSKFNLSVNDYYYNTELNKYLEKGEQIYKEHENIAQNNLKNFIYENGHIDGTALKNNWFGMEDVDIFISHSHKDISKVKALAGWLYQNFKLRVFIDSCVWNYCDDLLRMIDNNYCYKKETKMYDYQLRNYTTSHVHIMLSTALSEMIDRTECIMFYNTPSSICMKDDIEEIKKNKKDKSSKKVTLSPWIYHELAMTTMIKTSVPVRKGNVQESFSHYDSKTDNINIEHEVEEYLEDMVSIDEQNLMNWRNTYRKSQDTINGNGITSNVNESNHPLDVLYSLIKHDKCLL